MIGPRSASTSTARCGSRSPTRPRSPRRGRPGWSFKGGGTATATTGLHIDGLRDRRRRSASCDDHLRRRGYGGDRRSRGRSRRGCPAGWRPTTCWWRRSTRRRARVGSRLSRPAGRWRSTASATGVGWRSPGAHLPDRRRGAGDQPAPAAGGDRSGGGISRHRSGQPDRPRQPPSASRPRATNIGPITGMTPARRSRRSLVCRAVGRRLDLGRDALGRLADLG